MADNRFAGAEKAEIFGRGQYFAGEGNGEFKVADFLYKMTRESGAMIIIELEATSDIPYRIPEDPKAPLVCDKETTISAGSKRTVTQKLAADVAYPNLLGYVASIVGLDVREPEDLLVVNENIKDRFSDVLGEICDKKSFLLTPGDETSRIPIKGQSVHVTWRPYTKKKGGAIVTVQEFGVAKGA